MSAPDARVPVSLLTGALGSGKTTLLARLLRQPGMHRTAVIVNEYGEMALDNLLIGHSDGVTIALPGGCLCCAPASDFIATLQTLHERRAQVPFDRVAIETSGLADPLPILKRLGALPALRERFFIDSVIATVDAIQGERELGRQKVLRRQAAVADRLVLTKSDIASRPALARLQARLREINPSAPLIVASHGAVDATQLFGSHVDLGIAAEPLRQRLEAQHGDPAACDGEADHRHDWDIRTFCLEWNDAKPWSVWQAGLERLAATHGERLLRIKGLVATVDDPRPTVVNGVHELLYPPTTIDHWPDGERRSRLVFIVEQLSQSAVSAVLSEHIEEPAVV
jgi:G3E family GTPase